MSFFPWGDYVSVAERRRRAEKKIAELKRKGRSIAPVKIEGRKIAASFWGQSWCANLERYSDYATRLPRGRSYVRNGLVIDLQIATGKVTATVSGSELYDVGITIAPVAAKRWKAICRDCSGTIDSLIELLQGRLAKGVMDRVCREGDGLFPAPSEIKLSCSCPDWADMCKHVAGALYGIGARLDAEPRLLFELRGVDENELVAGADQEAARLNSSPATAKLLEDSDVAALFGLDMAENVGSIDAALDAAKPRRSSRNAQTTKRSAQAETPAPTIGKQSRPTRRKDRVQTVNRIASREKPVRRRARGKVVVRRRAKAGA
jgi:uncharacterized Zn finger protein